ncbi:MAG TPA: hypothetical protein VEJ36_08375 [Nitrososphaerales archaeon]|nr:hypothetical protein [Nitrososphaerales archaeon]
MPKCAQGHDCGLVLECPTCKSDVDYASALPELAKLPDFEPRFEETAVLFVGVPKFPVEGAFCGSLSLAKQESRTIDSYSFPKLTGGNWFEYVKAYRDSLGRWMGLVGYPQAKQVVAVLDSRDPLSVLALEAIRKKGGVTALLVAADLESTPAEQNTSYTSITAAEGAQIPAILATASKAKELASFVEGHGLVVGTDAFSQVVGFVLSASRSVTDFMQGDLKLGITSHFFACVMSASRDVYSSPSGIFQVLGTQLSGTFNADEVHTVYLLSSSSTPLEKDLRPAFDAFSKQFPNLITKDAAYLPKTTRLGFFDVMMLFGVKSTDTLTSLQKGYEKVAKRNGLLSVESLGQFS